MVAVILGKYSASYHWKNWENFRTKTITLKKQQAKSKIKLDKEQVMTHQHVKYNQQEGDRGSRNAKGKYTTETDTA